MIANSVKNLIGRKTTAIDGQPIEVRLASEFTGKEEFQKFEADTKAELRGLSETVQRGLTSADELRRASISGVYKTFEERLEKMRQEDARTGERLSAIEQQNRGFDKQFDDIKAQQKETNGKLDMVLTALQARKPN
ncbi:MAG: hypothetical protein E1N59_2845 [Puniceicoccaceae bacterium 5H]|nr:MAG: hypothetical protein E1N59_2845 [Puniceicoccaceae bacterium 5H]